MIDLELRLREKLKLYQGQKFLPEPLLPVIEQRFDLMKGREIAM
jgi:hypothetical protein